MGVNDPVLAPLQIRSLTLKNRIYSTGHAPAGYLENGRPGLRYELYHEEKAKGGLALTIIGGSSNVALESASVFSQIYAGDDDILPFYGSIADRVHRHGTAIMIQLTHLGRRSRWDIDHWLPPVSPSGVRERAHRSFPKVLERYEIERIVRDYGAAAQRAEQGGLDGIEVAALGGHLIDQFWSPRTNHRTDEFGGNLENRLRFGTMVLESIRSQVSDGFVVGMRIPGDEGAPGALTNADCIDIASAMNDTGMVDFFSVIYGGGNTDRELAEVISTFGRPLGGRIGTAKTIRDVVDAPVFHAGRIADLATARHALTSGSVDMVGMTRAHIADPHIVAKLLAGQEQRIRPCVGATYCASKPETLCLHNPSTGRESTLPHLTQPSGTRKRVLVIGGGPAGMEAARVCAERGHEVTLVEAADRLGGQVLLAARSPRHAEKAAIVHWLAAELKHLGVSVVLNAFADTDLVREHGPEVVIVATGGLPDVDVVATGAEHVISTWDALSVAPVAGRQVLIYDDHGDENALTAAEVLASGGAVVEVVTPDRHAGNDVTGMVYPDYLRALYGSGVTLTPDHELRSVERVGGGKFTATLVNAYTDEPVERVVDQIVVEHGTVPVDDLYVDLVSQSRNNGQVDLAAFVGGKPQETLTNPDGAFQLFRIGDAVAHRNLHAAMYDARRLAAQI